MSKNYRKLSKALKSLGLILVFLDYERRLPVYERHWYARISWTGEAFIPWYWNSEGETYIECDSIFDIDEFIDEITQEIQEAKQEGAE